jgi:3-deoxy-D-manno-octulosonic-acid transferase
MLAIYSAAYTSLLPLLLPLFALHPRLRGGLRQRLGCSPTVGERPVWLHGASAGDVVALTPLAQRLVSRDVPVALSTWTRSGHQMATRRLGHDAVVFRAPIDLAGPVRAVLDRVRPRMLVLECLEIWPRLVSECQLRGIPVAVIDGRISARSLRLFRGVRCLFEPCLRSLSLVVALTEQDAQRFVEAGAPADRVEARPSCKYGALTVGPAGGPARQKVVLGSLHREEERILIPGLCRLRAERPGLEIVIAPRYPHRAARLQRQLRDLGAPAFLSSQCGVARERGVRILDQVGQLAGEYRGARVAFVGGSLIPRGGHNLVEPAAAGCPVLVGPHTEHCVEEARLLVDEGAAIVIHDDVDFFRHTLALLTRPNLFGRCRAAGLRAAERLSSASNEVADRLCSIAEMS